MSAAFPRPQTSANLGSVFLKTWRHRIGPPKVIICDAGCQYEGPSRNHVSQMYGITAIPSPTGASYQTGKIERHIQLLIQAFIAVSSELGWNTDPDIRLSLAVLSHNIPCGY